MTKTRDSDPAAHTPAYGGVDLTTCDREPIHIPGAIQPHGVLLSVADPVDSSDPTDGSPGVVVMASANSGDLLGVPVEDVLGRTLADLIGDDAARLVVARAAQGASGESLTLTLPPGPGSLAGRAVDVVVHRSGERTVVEIEELGHQGTFALSYQTARGAMARLAQASSAADLGDRLAHEVRLLTGFDRVMIYRFDEQWNGEVIAEDRREDLNPFLGLHYPAADIPVQARRLYTVNWTRLIADISYVPVPLHPVLDPGTGAPLDLSHSTLRSVSPIHIEYLGNMGVGASMSVSLVVDDELWGLVACHHYSGAHRPSQEARSAAEFLGQVASQMLADRERADQREAALRAQAVLAEITARVSASPNSPLETLMPDQGVLDVVEAPGVALCFDGVITTQGTVPDTATLLHIATMLRRTDGVPVRADRVADFAPELAEHAAIAAGAMCIGTAPDRWLLWVRPEQEQIVDWGGDPTNKELWAKQGPEVRVSPRKSFDKWRQVVRGRSLPWTHWQADAAEALNHHITGLLLLRSREQIAMAESVQRSVVLAEAPAFPGLQIAARYLPASSYQLGGDWWDAFDLADGPHGPRVAIVVGDVAGHGVVAATAMTQVRTALRAYLFDGDTPAQCLDRLDRLMDGLLDQRVATAFVAVVEPSTGRVEMASAGHMPPMLFDGGGARDLVVPARPLLGVGAGVATLTEEVLPVGSTLVVYTDGLVERRGVDLAESLARLREVAGAGPAAGGFAELSAWADGLVGAVPGEQDDDTTILALRLTGL